MYVNGQCVRRKEILLLATHVKVMKGNATKIVKEKKTKEILCMQIIRDWVENHEAQTKPRPHST